MTLHITTTIPVASSTSELLARHNELSNHIAELTLERADIHAAITSARARLFASLAAEGHNITSIRERVQHETADLEVESIKLTGDIDAARARLHHLDVRLKITGDT